MDAMIGRLYVCTVSHRCAVFHIRVLRSSLAGNIVAPGVAAASEY